MKTYQKYVLGAMFAFLISLFSAVNPVYALETNEVQPAELIKYEEPVTVNSSLVSTLPSYFLQGVHIGTVGGDGGVLFANGTILNVSRTKKDNKPVPLTIGDDLRVDGEIWRGNMRGTADNMPLKVSDYLVPTLDDTYDLGEPVRRWQNLYLSGNLQGNDAVFSGDVEIEGNLIVSGSTNINDLNVSNVSTFDGDIVQSIDKFGAVKAAVKVNKDGTCEIKKGWSGITCSREYPGTYEVDFNNNKINDSIYNVTALMDEVDSDNFAAAGTNDDDPDSDVLFVDVFDLSLGDLEDNSFMVVIY